MKNIFTHSLSPSTAQPLNPLPSLRRIYALIYRSLVLLLNSPPRLIEAMYWPTLNMLLMGFMNSYLMKAMNTPGMSFNLILGATILLEFFLRAGVSLLLVLMEEIYARNIGQIYASPLRAWEQVMAYVAVMLLRLTIGLGPAMIFCSLIFHYNILSLGVVLLPFCAILVTSGIAWGLLLISLILRCGQAAEWFGWMLGWLFVPFLGVYYPPSVLPPVMQAIGSVLPPTYVFQALRDLSRGAPVDMPMLYGAFGLAVFYVVLASLVFGLTLRNARQRGALLNLTE